MGLKQRGRPVQSVIRQNIIEILYILGEGYGYDIWKTYVAIFPRCTMRSIHYHLKKGLETGEFVVKAIKKESGDYSWGSSVEKIYYALGPQAAPRGNERVREYLQRKKKQ